MAIDRIGGAGGVGNTSIYAQRNRYNSTQSISDVQMYERMTSMITTAPSTRAQSTVPAAQNSNQTLTNGGRDIILNSRNNTFSHSRDADALRLMSARNQLADTNIAHASLVGNRNNIVNQYQHFMRQGAHDSAKHALNRMA
ncbi:MAG: hypothetical protein FWE20_08145 [Defluviitaleaceae bacterium]|nr:hypothetical protein [Defluviitaleaceae bacterium]